MKDAMKVARMVEHLVVITAVSRVRRMVVKMDAWLVEMMVV
jgi:hypothetical protein